MSGITEDTPLGLAAAARETGTKVTQLRKAIAEGKLEAIPDALDPEARLVTPRAIHAMLAADEFTSEAVETAGNEGVEAPGEETWDEPAPAPKPTGKKKLAVKK